MEHDKNNTQRNTQTVSNFSAGQELPQNIQNLNIYSLTNALLENENKLQQTRLLLDALTANENPIPAEQQVMKNYEYNDLFYVQGALTAANAHRSTSTVTQKKQFFENLLARLNATKTENSEMQPFREAFEQQINQALNELEKHNMRPENLMVNKAVQTDIEPPCDTSITASHANANTTSFLDSSFL